MEMITLDQCKRAFYNQSFSPERRGAQTFADFKVMRERVAEKAGEEKAKKFERLFSDWLNSESRCASSMITGPARFPVFRQEKARASAEKKNQALNSFYEKVTTPKVESCIIKSGDSEAVQKLESKLAELKERRFKLKEAKKNGLEFQWYELPYLSRNIKEVKKRLEVEKIRAQCESKEELIGDIRIVFNIQINRLQIFHPDKPDRAHIADLKKWGFRWTPSVGCWQAYINDRSRSAVDVLFRKAT